MTTTTATVAFISSFPGEGGAKELRDAPPPIRVILESACDKWQHAAARYDRLLAGSRWRRASAGSSSVHQALAMVLRRRREIYHSLTDDRNERVTFGSSHSFPRVMDRRSKIVASVIAAYWYLRHHISCCWIMVVRYYQQRALVSDYSLLRYRKSFATTARRLPIYTRITY